MEMAFLTGPSLATHGSLLQDNDRNICPFRKLQSNLQSYSQIATALATRKRIRTKGIPRKNGKFLANNSGMATITTATN
jgi:hypothetical protein